MKLHVRRGSGDRCRTKSICVERIVDNSGQDLGRQSLNLIVEQGANVLGVKVISRTSFNDSEFN